MLTLCCDRCENVTFLRRDSNFSLNATFFKFGRRYCATPSVCSSTGTKSSSLDTHLHLNEYDTDCLLSVCVYLHLLTIMSGFSCSCLCNRCRLLSHVCVCPDDRLDFVKWGKHCVFALCSCAVLGGLN